MINYDKVTAIEYFKKKKEILESFGRTDGVCVGVNFKECPLSYSFTGYPCNEHEMIEPLEAVKCVMDYEIPEIPVDWSKVSVDTKILVRNNKDEEWENRHFANYENDKVYCWNDGKTSFTSNTVIKKVSWNLAKLYEREE